MSQKAETVSNKEEKKQKAVSQLSKNTASKNSVMFSGQTPVLISPDSALALQQMVGNTVVQRLVEGKGIKAREEWGKRPSSTGLDEEDEQPQAPLAIEEGEQEATQGGEESTNEEESVPGAPFRQDEPEPGNETETNNEIASENETETEDDKSIPSAVSASAKSGFVDQGMVDSSPAWWTGASPAAPGQENPAPAAFVDAGNAGNQAVWWTEMNLNGPPWGGRGTAGTGTFSVVTPPVYKTSFDKASFSSKAWIQDGTGTFTASRGYHGVNAGVQNGTTVYYLSALAAPRINQHEQGHTDRTREVYQNTLQVGETKYHGEANALSVPGNAEATAASQLQAWWAQVQTDFRTQDNTANIPISATSDASQATWDRQEIASPNYTADYGKQKLSSGTTYNHYVKRRDEAKVE
jgi:hypothetical protein